MTSEPKLETLVTKEMQERRGVWGESRVSPPIALSDIRKWAIAVYWPEKPPRLYWDEQYAKTTRWGGIIAPQEFNPFAWPVEREVERAGAAQRDTGPGTRIMNGGQVETFGVPMRPGDVITARSRLKEWDERQTRLGLTIFSYTELEWRNQRNELVKTRISTSIRY